MGELIFKSKGVPRKVKGLFIGSIIFFIFADIIMLLVFLLGFWLRGVTKETIFLGIFVTIIGILIIMFAKAYALMSKINFEVYPEKIKGNVYIGHAFNGKLQLIDLPLNKIRIVQASNNGIFPQLQIVTETGTYAIVIDYNDHAENLIMQQINLFR